MARGASTTRGQLLGLVLDDHPLRLGILLGLAGFALALLVRQPIYTYTTAAICGFLFGRAMYHKQGRFFPYLLLVFEFLIGYILASDIENWPRITAIFFAGYFVSYYAHSKKLLT